MHARTPVHARIHTHAVHTQALQEVIGPHTDIPAPDINTDEHHMAWIFDQYSRLRGFAPAAVTGARACIA